VEFRAVLAPSKKFRIPSSEEIREARRRALEGEPMSPPTIFGIILEYCGNLVGRLAERFGRHRRSR